MTQDILDRAKKIKILIVDIDGVMTDGRIIYSGYGDELRFFDVQDGFGITLLNRAGIKTIIITAGKSKTVRHRARDLKITKVYNGFLEKTGAFDDILKRFDVTPEEICFIGDDLIDIPILKRVGFAVAVNNAVDEVKKSAHHITASKGGRGAVRETCDLLLKSQGKWGLVTAKYFR